jgi:hypothetical protein
MTPSDKLQQTLRLVSANYGKALAPEQVELFKAMAKQHGANLLCDAIMRHMQDPDVGMFFPNMAHVSAQIVGTQKQADASLEATAGTEWFAVLDKIRKVGAYGSPKFENPLTAAAIHSLGGWVQLCRKTEDELRWLSKNFTAEFKSAGERNPEFLPNKVQGLIALKNNRPISSSSNGSTASLGTLIGEAAKRLKNDSRGNDGE